MAAVLSRRACAACNASLPTAPTAARAHVASCWPSCTVPCLDMIDCRLSCPLCATVLLYKPDAGKHLHSCFQHMAASHGAHVQHTVQRFFWTHAPAFILPAATPFVQDPRTEGSLAKALGDARCRRSPSVEQQQQQHGAAGSPQNQPNMMGQEAGTSTHNDTNDSSKALPISSVANVLYPSSGYPSTAGDVSTPSSRGWSAADIDQTLAA